MCKDLCKSSDPARCPKLHLDAEKSARNDKVYAGSSLAAG